MRFLHVIVTHLQPEKVLKHLELTRLITPGVRSLIAYGGPAPAFERLEVEDKIFLADESLRGPIQGQCFNELFPKIWSHARERGIEFDFAHISEYDHLIFRADYFDQIAGALERSGADFLGRGCGSKAHSNWPHRFEAEQNPALLGFLRAHSVREDKTEIWGSLGNGIVISRAAVRAWAEVPAPPRAYNELLFPTLAHHLGFKVDDIGRYSDLLLHVRWGPVWTTDEIRELIRRGAACAHPFKDIDAAEALLREQAGGLTKT